MALKHNNQIPHNHFRKDWQRRVRVHFDQPGRKSRRRTARVAKAARVAPRPVDRLRPVVQCPTVKYNRRARAGRGFTLQELKEAGIARKLAPTIGISVDFRRVNHSQESLTANVARLKAYKDRLILFPRKSGQHKKSDSSAEEVKAIEGKHTTSVAAILPIDTRTGLKYGFTEVKQSEAPKGEENVYAKLRNLRADARFVGVREKRAKAKAEAEEAKKGK